MNGSETWLERCRLDNEADAERLYELFIERIDRSMLADKAEQDMKEKASDGGALSIFADHSGGLIGFTIRKLVFDATYSSLDATDCLSIIGVLVDRLAEFYGFPENWVPSHLLIREALALTVRRREIVNQLQREFGKSVEFASVFDRAAVTIERVMDAYLLDDEHTDAVLEELRQ